MMTTWQDWVLAITVLGFNVALLPSVWGSTKPRLATSLLTALCLLPQAIVFFSLSLWYSLIMVIINATLWLTLALQVILRNKAKPRKKASRIRT